MGLFDKLEQRLERGVHGAFAKAFRSEVQPVELASAVRRAMDDRATNAGKGKRPIVPNLFGIELSTTDYDRLTAYEEQLADELKASAAEHAESQRYTPGGPLTVVFSERDDLETGVFAVRPSIARQAAALKDAPPKDAPDQPQHEPASEVANRTYDDPAAQRPEGAFALPGHRPAQSQVHAQAPAPTDERTHTADADTAGDHPIPRFEDQPDPAPAYDRTDPLRPSAAAPRRFKQRPYIDIDGDRYPLIGAITVIGRDDDVDIVLDDPGISRRHSEIRVTNDGPHLIAALSDLGSTNGTFVNGQPITSVHLTDGDRITVGRISMIFREGRRR
ncbi:DUF3662 domain-containing protein [Calidifontibacter sp. DB0510]|uniref:DUF3662 domain-containing protein n=1 Tax=Metallococcus carri TaxID=1656884 RepID=A0A967B2G4_9MICO|nr:DUF3662 domain-containing protein [Metallococcus carri]NOP38784.1 DUF3662 domain-containing protein [Calidifontibacter sp. DB2511S]